jgi:putative membrane protein insertion efficiency factor
MSRDGFGASRIGRTVGFVVRLPALLVVGLLRGWQLLVSPTYGATCRFYPSCSAYAAGAISSHGLIRGGWLALRRLGRCHPWNPGGVDHVPVNTRAKVFARPGGASPETNQTCGAESGHRAA